MTDKSRYLLRYEQQMLFVAHEMGNMSSKARYLLMYEQQMMFVAHKIENMSNKFICCAQMHNKFVCRTQNGKNVQQICLTDTKSKI